jgi:hypothetical protein
MYICKDISKHSHIHMYEYIGRKRCSRSRGASSTYRCCLYMYIDLHTDTITNTYINECIYKCPHSYVSYIYMHIFMNA